MLRQESADLKFGRPLVVSSLTKGTILSGIIMGGILLLIGGGLLIFGITNLNKAPASAPAWSRWTGAAAGHPSNARELRQRFWSAPVLHIFGGGVLGVLGSLSACVGLRELIKSAETRTFYERGVRVVRDGNTRELAYRDADVAYYLEAGGSGVRRHLDVYSPDGSPAIHAGTSAQEGETPEPTMPSAEQIEELRDIVVDAVAERMLADLAAGRKVEWSRGVCLVPDGVMVDTRLIAWAKTDEAANQEDGRYDLLEAGQKRALATMRMIDRNFLPGWRVVQTMRQRALSSAAAA